MTVVFNGSRDELRKVIARLGGILSGRNPDERGIGEGFRAAVGFAALSSVKEAYVLKARGGTDEMGIKWPPLAESTIANRRVGPGVRATEIRDRERIRKREKAKALKRYRLSLPEKEAQRRAAIVGGLKATHITGKTKLETLGRRQVEILRDTGVLLNSLNPGELREGVYTPATDEGAEDQVFDVRGTEIAVGTKVTYASAHQNGTQHIPARPFLPSDDYPVPEVWWTRWLQIANKTLVVIARRLFEQ